MCALSMSPLPPWPLGTVVQVRIGEHAYESITTFLATSELISSLLILIMPNIATQRCAYNHNARTYLTTFTLCVTEAEAHA